MFALPPSPSRILRLLACIDESKTTATGHIFPGNVRRMAKDSDPTKDPEFQKAVQALLKAPPQPHKPLGKRAPDKKTKVPKKDSDAR